MVNTTNEHIKNVIKGGDKGSAILAEKCFPTLKNSEYARIVTQGKNGIAVLKVPDEYICLVHSFSGNPAEENVLKHAESLVDGLVKQAEVIKATPVAFTNVIGSNSSDLELISAIGDALVGKANQYKIPIMNGGLAILGERIDPRFKANVSGTMISILKKEDFWKSRNPPLFWINKFGIWKDENVYAAFESKGKWIYMNSDGVGTKTEFYERLGNYKDALQDSLAMKLDDAIEIGASATIVSDVVETTGNIPFNTLREHAVALGHYTNVQYILQHIVVRDRLNKWEKEYPVFNVSGTAISTIDNKVLENPLKPSEGDYLVAIKGLSIPWYIPLPS
ncbi:MAG: hypothetical protein N3D84_02385 [Candidatus Woesearchaeota archaeon]|nr:hypothetical protein [Candidatus Woesearchaeota archaeon]